MTSHLQLAQMKTELTKALESYRAALGKNSNVGIENVITILEEAEKRLPSRSAPPPTTPCTAVHYEQPLRMPFSPDLSTAQYCDDAFNRLNLNPSVSQEAVDESVQYSAINGHSVDVDRKDTRRKLNRQSTSANRTSSSSPDSYSSVTQIPAITDNNSVNNHAFENGHRDASANPSLTSRDTSTESFLEPTSSSQSFATYAELLQSKADGDGNKGASGSLHQRRGTSGGLRATPDASVYANSNGIYRRHKPIDFERRPITEWSQFERPGSPEDRRDELNSESGDEGPMHLVTSRTSTSLHDRAESARSQKDDGHSSDFLATDASGSFLDERERRSRRQSRSSYTSPFEHGDWESGYDRQTDTEQPAMAQANMSFASTLYQTRHARVESITDAGVFLRRSNVRGDGRCLFRALSRCRAVSKGRAIPGERVEREEADRLRERAVAELIKQRELLDRFFVIEGDFGQYLKKMSHPRTYGGEPELLMLAKVLHVPIAVYILKGNSYRQIQVYGKQYRGEPLRILYSDGIHYDALLTSD